MKGVKKGSKKVYDTAKEENIRRKERAEVRRAERRLEKNASGVSMDVKLSKDAVHKEDMTELSGVLETAREELYLSSEMAEIPMPKTEEKVLVAEKKEAEAEIRQEIPVKIAAPVTVEETAMPEPVMELEKPVQKRKKKAEASEEEMAVPQIIETASPVKKYQFPPLQLLALPKNHELSSE